jgi:hypothetical protein
MLYWENMKNVMVPYNGRQCTGFFPQTLTYRYTGYTYTIRRTGVFDQGIYAKACIEVDEVKKPLKSLEIRDGN